MADSNKNRKSSLRDFIRYHSDKMKGEERNAFERELQKDPFTKDASEGFASIEPHEVKEDTADLQKRIKKRVSRRQRFIFYRIAASIAVLMVISTLFIIIERNRSPVRITSSTDQAKPLDITESEPVTRLDETSQAAEKQIRITKKKANRAIAQQYQPEPEEQIVSVRDNEISAYQPVDSIPGIVVKQPQKLFRSEEVAAVPAAIQKGIKSSNNLVRGRVISSEDNEPLPGVNIIIKGTDSGVLTDREGNFSIPLPDSDNRTLIATYIGMEPKEFEALQDTHPIIRMDPSLTSLSEIVVTGFGVSKSESEKEDSHSTYIPPKPINGKSYFDKYIRENIRRPDTTSSGQKVVVLNFIVHTDGSVDSIKIIRSPGKPFSDEAIRLIRSGPDWKPAEEGGILIEDQVRVRILFK